MMKNDIAFALPILFVVLYGSGFAITQYGLQYSSPFAFLFYRFGITMVLLTLLALYLKNSFPKSWKNFFHIGIAGVLTVGTFSVGVYVSLHFGVDASANALVIALQPILVTLLASLALKEQVSMKAWGGLFLGLIGVSFVILQNVQTLELRWGIFFSFVALLGLCLGNVYQKKFCSHMDLFSGGAIQNLFSWVLVIPFFLYEDSFVVWNMPFLLSLFGMILGVSVVALSLLYIMIKHKDVSKVASVFYLVPVSAAFFAWMILDASISWQFFVGVGLILAAISLIFSKKVA